MLLLPPKLKGCCGHDPFLIKRYNATEAIATSDAMDDDGLFELSFKDDRYLPFEFNGAVSKWRIELPRENNAFDFDSLTDFRHEIVLYVSGRRPRTR